MKKQVSLVKKNQKSKIPCEEIVICNIKVERTVSSGIFSKKIRLVSLIVHTMRKENRESQIGQSNLSFDKVQKTITKVKKISLYM